MTTLIDAVERLEWPPEAVELVGHMGSHRPSSPEGLAILAGAALMLARDAGTYGSAAKVAREFGELVMAMVDELERPSLYPPATPRDPLFRRGGGHG